MVYDYSTKGIEPGRTTVPFNMTPDKTTHFVLYPESELRLLFIRILTMYDQTGTSFIIFLFLLPRYV